MNQEQRRKWLQKDGWTLLEGALLLADIDPETSGVITTQHGPKKKITIKCHVHSIASYADDCPRGLFLEGLEGPFKVKPINYHIAGEIFRLLWRVLEEKNTSMPARRPHPLTLLEHRPVIKFLDNPQINHNRLHLLDIRFRLAEFEQFAKIYIATIRPPEPLFGKPYPVVAVPVPIFGLTVPGVSDISTPADSMPKQENRDGADSNPAQDEEINRLRNENEEQRERCEKLERELNAVVTERDELKAKLAATPPVGAGEEDLGRGVTLQDVRELLKTTKEQAGAAATLPLAAMIEAFVHVRRYGSNRNGTNAAIRDYLKKNFVGEDGKCIFSQNVLEAMGKVSNWRAKPGRPRQKTED